MNHTDIVRQYYLTEAQHGGLAEADPKKVKAETASACGVTEAEVSRVMLDELNNMGAG